MSPSPLVAVWNLLHDGSIESIDWLNDGSLVLGVGIEYLTERMNPPVDTIRVRLFECKDLEYVRFVSGAADQEVCELNQLKGAGILSANSSEAPFTVWLDDGKLTVSYSGVTLFGEDDREMSMEELDKVAREYWETFGKK